ncbi:MAG: hypothetical protein JNJ57_05910 [Saprospiraceae bacterium]|nr:hypothetical protein [Saprospiraceae bacterium]
MLEETNKPQAKPVKSSKPGFFEKLTNWELWPAWAIYAPLSPVMIYYAIRCRSIWFFTNSNPTIEFGGYEGEAKSDVYAQMPIDCYPRTLNVTAGEDFEQLKKRISDAGFQYPYAVKPDVGRKGLMFRKIDREEQLLQYHNYFPFNYVVQELIDLPIEYGIFYVRHPSQQKGMITGIFMRESLEVYGDGKTTLRELILNHPYAGKRAEEWFAKHRDRLDWAPADRERFVISYAINRSRGARLRNVSHEADAELAEFFDRISLHNGNFFWGRYDIKCTSLAELKQGKNYYILEYNGAGASPSQIYHCGKTLFQAYAIILQHWKWLFEISKWNHDKAGIPYWPFWKGYRYLQNVNRYLDNLEKYDLGI